MQREKLVQDGSYKQQVSLCTNEGEVFITDLKRCLTAYKHGDSWIRIIPLFQLENVELLATM